MRQLTPQEEAVLDDLSVRNNDRSPKFTKDDTYQRKLLSGLLQEPALSAGIALVEPTYFNNVAHCQAFEILKSFWTEFGQLPSKFVVTDKLQEKLKDAEPATVLHRRAEIEAVYDDYFCPGLVDSQYILDELRKWSKEQAVRQVFAKLTTRHLEEGTDIDHTIDELVASFADVRKLTATEQLTEDFTETMAQQETEDWLIRNWLEFGSLAMMSGDPFSGKSHILAEIFAAIFKHGVFGRYPVQSCAVLVIDAENKRRIIVKRLLNALGEGDLGACKELFRRVDTSRLTLPLPVESGPETIRSLIRDTKARTGQDRCFVVIDTLRSVFAADEMETGDMKSLLYPLQRVAQEENAAVLILHHRPKSGATYSGQTSIAGACDYLWLWESERSTGAGKLKLIGTRGDHQDDMSFRLVNGRNCFQAEAVDRSQDNEQDQQQELWDILEAVLADGELTQHELIKQVQLGWNTAKVIGPVPGRDKIRRALDSLVGSLLIVRQGDHNRRFFGLMSA